MRGPFKRRRYRSVEELGYGGDLLFYSTGFRESELPPAPLFPFFLLNCREEGLSEALLSSEIALFAVLASIFGS